MRPCPVVPVTIYSRRRRLEEFTLLRRRSAPSMPSKAGAAAADKDEHNGRDYGADDKPRDGTVPGKLDSGTLRAVRDRLSAELSRVAWLRVVQYQRRLLEVQHGGTAALGLEDTTGQQAGP